jgi:hypothetical protein
VLAALAVAIIIPAQDHADPPTKCLTNTPKGKQVYVPCDLLNAGANFPPGQRCPLPLEQYPKDVADWSRLGSVVVANRPGRVAEQLLTRGQHAVQSGSSAEFDFR